MIDVMEQLPISLADRSTSSRHVSGAGE